MPTASTKRGAKRTSARKPNETSAAGARAEKRTTEPPEPRGDEVPERVWQVAVVLVLAAAVLLRFVYLEINPLHHDEGVNGWFLTRLVRDGAYAYDPQNYHGPTLYFITLVPAFLLEKVLRVGMSVFMLRGVTSLFGVGLVWLVLSLRGRVGAVGALAGAALLAVSPGAVYQSRYFIHETLFVFFTLGIVVAALRFDETGEAKYLMLAFVTAALLFATKETAFISAGVLALAWGVAWGWTRLARRVGWERFAGSWRDESGADFPRPGAEPAPRAPSPGALGGFGGAQRFGLLLAAGLALFVAIYLLFYSSFFTNWKGVSDSVETFKFWSRTGMKEVAHAKRFDTYLDWLQQEEGPTYVLGLLGAAWAVLRARNRFAVFAGAWAFGLLAAYSLVKYKTPWLSLNFAVPMAIVGGYAVGEAYAWARGRALWRGFVVGCLAAALAVSLFQCVRLNFFRYDDDSYPYVYSHTRREFLQMLSEVERFGERAGTREGTPVALASPDYWPIPWYMRDYTALGYNASAPFTQPLVILNKSQEEADPNLRTSLAARYRRVGEYPLRPGVDLVLYARKDLTTP